MSNLLIMGCPGSGKGTFCELLRAKEYNVIGMGEILRHEVKKDTLLGQQIKNNVNQGILITDDLAFQIIQQKLIQILDQRKPFAIEGFPSTVPQYNLFLNFVKEHKLQQTMTFVYLDCSEENASFRLSARLTCQKCSRVFSRLLLQNGQDHQCPACSGALFHRPEDSFPLIQNRLQAFKEKTHPIFSLAQQSFAYKIFSTDLPLPGCLEQFNHFLQFLNA